MFWKVYGILIVFAAVIPSVLVTTAYNYGIARSAEYTLRDVETIAAMELHKDGLQKLYAAREYLAYLEERGLADEEVKGGVLILEEAFAQGDYPRLDVESGILKTAMRVELEEKQQASATALVDEFEQEVATAKKQGVKVDEVEKQIVVLEEKIEQRAYGEISGLITTQRAVLTKLVEEKKKSDEEARKRALAAAPAAPIAAQNNGGITYERKSVSTPNGSFTTDVLRVDLSRSWARTFVAHDGDCARDCAVKPLASYVSENGGVAGINGTYFCPPDYAHCVEKKNSFDLLVFDYARKKYSNSGNNQYSTNPLINFYPGRANLYAQALGFGRDTGASGVISNFPLLINNGTIVGGNTGKGTRGAIGFNGNVVWAVQVRSASFQDTAFVLQALGANNAMNLDGGGSSALYFGGYKVGPGRLLPNALVFGN